MQDLTGSCAALGIRRPTFLSALRTGLDILPLSRLQWEILAILCCVPVLLQAALWNGFPLLFFDTGAYMLEGFGHLFVPERAPVYALFLRYFAGQENLWFIAILQCLMVSFLIVETLRAHRPEGGVIRALLCTAALCLISSVSWISGQIEPDGFTAMVVLSLYLTGFHGRALGLIRTFVTILIGALAIAAHPSHIGLAAGLVICLAAYKLLRFFLTRRRFDLPTAGLPTAGPLNAGPLNAVLPGVVTVALAFAMIFAANYDLTHKVFFNRSGSTFFAARLIGTGVAKKTLNASCKAHPMPLCRYKDHLPDTADSFLWGPHTPFNQMGRFYGPRTQYDFLVRESLRRYPFEILGNGLWAGLRQFFMIRTGDGITYANWVLNPGFAHFMPEQSPAYLSARQQEGETGFKLINIFQVPILFAALIAIIVLMVQAIRHRQPRAAILPAFVLLALLGNALICGMCSGPHDRYQSRLIWLAPFALLVTGPRRSCRILLGKSGTPAA